MHAQPPRRIPRVVSLALFLIFLGVALAAVSLFRLQTAAAHGPAATHGAPLAPLAEQATVVARTGNTRSP